MPPRDEFQVRPHEQGEDLLSLLRRHLNLSGKQAKALLDRRNVFINGKRVWMAKHRCSAGDRISASLPETDSRNTLPDLLYESKHLLAVNKPSGMISESDKRSLEELLRTSRKEPSIRALHRLDKDTTGVLLFSRKPESKETYIDLFRDSQIDKRYRILVRGTPRTGVVQKAIDGQRAETDIRVLASHRGYSVVECRIATGRTHQIRRHLRMMDCAVAGDRQYGTRQEIPRIEQKIPRQMLHAVSIQFTCPFEEKELHIRAPLPADFTRTVNLLGLKKA